MSKCTCHCSVCVASREIGTECSHGTPVNRVSEEKRPTGECICPKNSNATRTDCPVHAMPTIGMPVLQEDWEKRFREKYEGANVWSSNGIDSVIKDIRDLLKSRDSH